MTTPTRHERDLPDVLRDLATSPTPDYIEQVLDRTARTRQRPAWASRERWFAMSAVSPSIPSAMPAWRRLVLLAVVVAAALMAVIVGSGALRSPVPAPFGPATNGALVYSWLGDIYSRADATAEPVPLVVGPDLDMVIGFSPDNRALAFLRQPKIADDVWDLWVANADGTSPRRIGVSFEEPGAMGSGFNRVEWAPGGDALLVNHRDGETPIVHLVPVDGSGAVSLTVEGQAATLAVFRPTSGSQLAVRVDGPDGPAIVITDRNGSRLSTLGLPEGAGEDALHDLAWSASGDRLAYALNEPKEDAPGTVVQRLHIATIDPEGRLVSDRRLASDNGDWVEWGPMWLPDGSGVVFHRFTPDAGDRLVLARGDEAARPTDLGINANWFYASLSPDGRLVVAQSLESRSVSLVDLATLDATETFHADDGARWGRAP